MKTPIEYFYHWVEHAPNEPFLRQPKGDTWTVYSYRQAYDEALRMAAYMQRSGLNRGDHVAILSRNCCHWILAD
ncbi:MAG: AMP-binding protein, partial [Bacteroidota bacterium]